MPASSSPGLIPYSVRGIWSALVGTVKKILIGERDQSVRQNTRDANRQSYSGQDWSDRRAPLMFKASHPPASASWVGPPFRSATPNVPPAGSTDSGGTQLRPHARLRPLQLAPGNGNLAGTQGGHPGSLAKHLSLARALFHGLHTSTGWSACCPVPQILPYCRFTGPSASSEATWGDFPDTLLSQ